MKKKLIATILAASLALGMLAGCGDTGAVDGENVQTENGSGAGADNEDSSAAEGAGAESSEGAENSESV